MMMITHKRFLKAVKQGDTSIVAAALRSPKKKKWLHSYSDDFLPIHYAIINGHADVLRLLLEAGADPLKEEKRIFHFDHKTGIQMLCNSAKENRKKMIDAFSKAKIPAETHQKYLDLLLYEATTKTAYDEVLHLLDNTAANLNAYACLHRSIENNAPALAKLLLQRGARTNIYTAETKTFLFHTAAASNCQEIVPDLLEQGADINALDKNGNTPLHIAVLKKHYKMVGLLLKNGARTDIRNNKGETPLILARENATPPIIELLENAVPAATTSQAAATIQTATEAWTLMGEDGVLFTGIYPDRDLRLTQAFNFEAAERISTFAPVAAAAPTPVIEPFTKISQQAIARALEGYKAAGGKKDFAPPQQNFIPKKLG